MKSILAICTLLLASFCGAQQSTTGTFTAITIPALQWGPAVIAGKTICTPSSSATCSLPFVAGTPETVNLSVTGGTAPFTWAVTAGALPAGLSLGSSTTASNTISGTLTGTCPATGSCWTITVSDSSPVAMVIEIKGPKGQEIANNWTFSGGGKMTCRTFKNGNVMCAGKGTQEEAQLLAVPPDPMPGVIVYGPVNSLRAADLLGRAYVSPLVVDGGDILSLHTIENHTIEKGN